MCTGIESATSRTNATHTTRPSRLYLFVTELPTRRNLLLYRYGHPFFMYSCYLFMSTPYEYPIAKARGSNANTPYFIGLLYLTHTVRYS